MCRSKDAPCVSITFIILYYQKFIPMNSSYTQVVIYLFLSVVGISQSQANTSVSFLFDCNTDTLSLCVEDDGVRLPSNNKIYLGENHPDATSCSVHVSQSIKVQPECPGVVHYEVQLFLFSFGEPIILQTGTSAATDSLGEVELFFDSQLSADTSISQNGIPYTTGCDRYHRIKWIVTNSCGQVSVCEQLVDLYDCVNIDFSLPSEPPIIFYHCDWFKAMHLKDIVKILSHDCSFKDEMLLSFEQGYYKPDSSIMICYVPAFAVEVKYNFWIADKGRDLNCDGEVTWTERTLTQGQIKVIFLTNDCIVCDPPNGTAIGEIMTEDQQSVEKVTVSIFSSGLSTITYNTTDDGKYFFTNINEQEKIIVPTRNDNHRNGVSTLDLVRIQKHLLGIELLSSPYDVIAADANKSNALNVLDLVELRKLVLGKYIQLPSVESWRFVPKKLVFSDSNYPWPFDEVITIPANEEIGDIDFVAIKVGDVNNTVDANATGILPRNPSPLIKFKTLQIEYEKNEIIEIPITLDDLEEIQGFQFTISSPDLEFVSVTSNTIDISDEHCSLFGDKITMSWFDMDGIDFDKDDVIFTLKAKAIKNGSLKSGFTINSEITEAEVYSMQDEIFTPQLLIHDDSEVNTPALMPNPWKEQTTIVINLKEDGIIEIEILYLNGRTVYSETKYLLKGSNEILLESKNFAARGLLMYLIKTETETLSGKMVVLK